MSVRNARKQGLVAIKGLAGEDDKYRAETQVAPMHMSHSCILSMKPSVTSSDTQTSCLTVLHLDHEPCRHIPGSSRSDS